MHSNKSLINKLDEWIDTIQSYLNFDFCQQLPQYKDSKSLGRIGVTTFILGLTLGFHLFLMGISYMFIDTYSYSFVFFQWSLYVICLCSFHFMEFFVTSVKQPEDLSYDSLIINHSKSYTVAALSSWIEFWIEYVVFGFQFKRNGTIIFIGFVLVLAGQIIRNASMWTCGENFSHRIMENKTTNHVLVKKGIYQ